MKVTLKLTRVSLTNININILIKDTMTTWQIKLITINLHKRKEINPSIRWILKIKYKRIIYQRMRIQNYIRCQSKEGRLQLLQKGNCKNKLIDKAKPQKLFKYKRICSLKKVIRNLKIMRRSLKNIKIKFIIYVIKSNSYKQS